MSSTALSPPQSQRPLFQGHLLLPDGPHTLAIFIDSGADARIIDEEVVLQLVLERVPLPHLVPARALDGHILGTVTHQTSPVHLLLPGNHHETVQFHILSSSCLPLILGYPWLRLHNPHIDWVTGAVRERSSSCHQRCLQQTSAPLHSSSSSFSPDLTGVPPEYHGFFRQVFSTARATSLPPHRPYDCAIDLLPGTSTPKGPLYSLSEPERKVMETYINDSLAAGIIRPSSSPAGAGFFFVEKKDKTLTTEDLMISLSRTVTHCHSSPLPLNCSRGPPFSPNLTDAMPTTSSASEKEMSGRQHSTPQPDTMNTS